MDSSLIEITEELNRNMELKRRDERLYAELLGQALSRHAEVYHKEVAKGSKSYKKMTGFMLQSIFGKKNNAGNPIWLIKDLDAGQLLHLLDVMKNKVKKVSNCCDAELESHEVEVPNFKHNFDPSQPKTKLSFKKFCSKCGARNIPI